MNWIFIKLLFFYKYAISPWIGNRCRFIPSCSEYAIESFKKYAFFKAFSLTIKRLSKCHPKGGSGYDPVP